MGIKMKSNIWSMQHLCALIPVGWNLRKGFHFGFYSHWSGFSSDAAEADYKLAASIQKEDLDKAFFKYHVRNDREQKYVMSLWKSHLENYEVFWITWSHQGNIFLKKIKSYQNSNDAIKGCWMTSV